MTLDVLLWEGDTTNWWLLERWDCLRGADKKLRVVFAALYVPRVLGSCMKICKTGVYVNCHEGI